LSSPRPHRPGALAGSGSLPPGRASIERDISRRRAPPQPGEAERAFILAAIAEAAPTREALLRDANRRGERPPALNVAKLTAIGPDARRLIDLNRRREYRPIRIDGL
jgi:hypothetical protein